MQLKFRKYLSLASRKDFLGLGGFFLCPGLRKLQILKKEVRYSDKRDC